MALSKYFEQHCINTFTFVDIQYVSKGVKQSVAQTVVITALLHYKEQIWIINIKQTGVGVTMYPKVSL